MMVYDDERTGVMPSSWSLLFDLAAVTLGAGAMLLTLHLLGLLALISPWTGLA
jgi:hypothetical protein